MSNVGRAPGYTAGNLGTVAVNQAGQSAAIAFIRTHRVTFPFRQQIDQFPAIFLPAAVFCLVDAAFRLEVSAMPRLVSALVLLALASPTVAQPNRAAPRRDRYGDPLPTGAIARFGTARYRVGGWIRAARLSPDGKWVAAVADDGVHLLEAATGKQSWCCPGNNQSLPVFTPDSRALAVCNPNHLIELRDAGTGKVRQSFDGPTDDEAYLAVSGDGRTLAVAGKITDRDTLVLAWNLRNGAERTRIELPNKYGFNIALSPDGKLLACWGGREPNADAPDRATALTWQRAVHLRDIATGREVHRLDVGDSEVTTAIFSPDGNMLAAAEHGDPRNPPAFPPYARLWDVRTGKERAQLPADAAPSRGSLALSFSPDSKTLATADEKGVIHLADSATGKLREAFQHPEWQWRDFTFVSKKRIILCEIDDSLTIRVWDARTGKALGPPLVGPHNPIAGVAFTPGGNTIVIADKSGSLYRWRVGSVALPHWVHRVEGGTWNAFVLSPDGQYLARTGEQRLTLWRASDGKRLWPPKPSPQENVLLYYPPHPSPTEANAVAFLPGNKVLVGIAYGPEIRRWDIVTGKRLPDWKGTGGKIDALAVSADGQVLALCTETTDPRTGGERGEIDIHFLKTGEPDRHFAVPGRAWRVALSPDHRYLAITTGWVGELSLWNVATGKPVFRLAGNYTTMAFAPNGQMLAAGRSDNQESAIELIEIATGQVRRRWSGHRGSLTCLAFSPDNKLLVSGGMDTTVLVWDVYAQKQAEAMSVPGPNDGKSLWLDLADAGGGKGFTAIQRLANHPTIALSLFRKYLTPVPVPDPAKLAKWIAQLDDRRFAVRREATRQLAQLADVAEPALRGALGTSLSPEARRRVQHLLDAPARLSPDRLRVQRAIEVLEANGDADAMALLNRLASGFPAGGLTQQAKDASARLRSRHK